MKWLPARAYDNGIYIVFSNPIGMDDDQLKNGCSMILRARRPNLYREILGADHEPLQQVAWLSDGN